VVLIRSGCIEAGSRAGAGRCSIVPEFGGNMPRRYTLR
jgi:hypothetical protein